MRRITKKNAVDEIKRLIEKHRGILTPKQLVAAARPNDSPLHQYFTWDNTKAAERWRIYEAGRVLRVCVEWLPQDKSGPVRVTAHLTSDTTGGYRALTTILSDTEMRKQLLADAMADIKVFQQKYEKLHELAVVFRAIKKVSQRQGKK